MPAFPALTTIATHAARHSVHAADPLRQPLAQARATALAYQAIWNHPRPADVYRHELRIPTRHQDSVSARLFTPRAMTAPSPVLVYFHGGGFALNNLDSHDRLLRLLALRSGVTVAAISYGLAPELRFPGQLEQALDAIAWLQIHGDRLDLDARTWAVGGDSAGANLALAATLALRDRNRGLTPPRLGVLLYGMFSADLASASHQAFGGGGFGLTSERVDWFWSQYLADFAQRDNPLAAPLNADLHDLPPQLVIGAGLDCLLDDSLALAAKLKRSGVIHQLSVYEGMPHSFMQMSALLPPADAAVSETAHAVAAALKCENQPAAE